MITFPRKPRSNEMRTALWTLTNGERAYRAEIANHPGFCELMLSTEAAVVATRPSDTEEDAERLAASLRQLLVAEGWWSPES
jgi:hypothetical protein